MTFEAWIRKQKNRDDATGDLAKDFIFDAKSKYAREKEKIKLTLNYLRSQGACDDAINAYKEAKKEYKEFLKYESVCAASKPMVTNEPQKES